jgi:GNAT superfamily N-acetyltransferase
LGLEPPPLKADYGVIFATMEVWIAEERDILRGVLILDVQPDALVIWSMAAAPHAQGQGLGQILLDAAEIRARQHGLKTLRLTTGAVQTALVVWYSRHGYAVKETGEIDGRPVIHMLKHLDGGRAG